MASAEQNQLREKLVSPLATGPAKSAQLAKSLATSEHSVLQILERLRAERLAQHMAGEWSLNWLGCSATRRHATP
jgi:predicted ArsR family transcriptional regulator